MVAVAKCLILIREKETLSNNTLLEMLDNLFIKEQGICESEERSMVVEIFCHAIGNNRLKAALYVYKKHIVP